MTDISEMREKVIDIVARQADIPWGVVVTPPAHWVGTRQSLIEQTKWGGFVMNHILPPKEQDE